MNTDRPVNRRDFLAEAGSAALSLGVLASRPGVAQAARTKVKLGLIGCGSRGVWIMNRFKKHGGFELHACADYFPDRVKIYGNKFDIPSHRRFTTLSSYRALLDSGVEAVAIESPPYFHPQQVADAIDAGLHVYVAKPIAVDVPGCRSIERSGLKATEKKRCLLVDFQTRANDYYREGIKRMHAGALGTLTFGEATYHAEIPWADRLKMHREGVHDPEIRLRTWTVSRPFSGDIITEQNIHTLDVMSWMMQTPPLHAMGTGGHKVRGAGDCYDHFACLYQYGDGVGITFSSRQFPGHGVKPDGIVNRIFGSLGVLQTEYGGRVLIRGKHFYKGGKTGGIYESGVKNNIATFYRNITEGHYGNDTVAPSVQSNLITILGRTAAYQRDTVTWERLMKSTEVMEPDLRGLKT